MIVLSILLVFALLYALVLDMKQSGQAMQIGWLKREIERLDADIGELYDEGPDPDDGEPAVEETKSSVVAFRRVA